jgi:hypothetical protein
VINVERPISDIWRVFWMKYKMTLKTSAYAVGDIVRVSTAAPRDYRRRSGIVSEIGPGKAEYRIEFEDGDTPTTGYLAAAWLEATGK